MPKTHDETKRLVDRAEKCRVLAGIVTNRGAAQSYLKLADSYEALAEEERKLSRSEKSRRSCLLRLADLPSKAASGRLFEHI